MWNYIIPAYLANPKLWYIHRRWQRLHQWEQYDGTVVIRDRNLTHRDNPSYIRSMKDAGRGHLL